MRPLLNFIPPFYERTPPPLFTLPSLSPSSPTPSCLVPSLPRSACLAGFCGVWWRVRRLSHLGAGLGQMGTAKGEAFPPPSLPPSLVLPTFLDCSFSDISKISDKWGTYGRSSSLPPSFPFSLLLPLRTPHILRNVFSPSSLLPSLPPPLPPSTGLPGVLHYDARLLHRQCPLSFLSLSTRHARPGRLWNWRSLGAFRLALRSHTYQIPR